MKRILGMLIACIAFHAISSLFGAPVAVALAFALAGGAIALIGSFYWAKHRARKIRRSACDDAIKYARKKRSAFGEPDFSEGELVDMRRFRKRNDLPGVFRLIHESNARLRSKKASQSGAG